MEADLAEQNYHALPSSHIYGRYICLCCQVCIHTFPGPLCSKSDCMSSICAVLIRGLISSQELATILHIAGFWLGRSELWLAPVEWVAICYRKMWTAYESGSSARHAIPISNAPHCKPTLFPSFSSFTHPSILHPQHSSPSSSSADHSSHPPPAS